MLGIKKNEVLSSVSLDNFWNYMIVLIFKRHSIPPETASFLFSRVYQYVDPLLGTPHKVKGAYRFTVCPCV